MFIGLQSAGIIVNNDATLVTYGDFHNINMLLSIFGLLLMIILHIRKVTGAILISIVVVEPSASAINAFLALNILPFSSTKPARCATPINVPIVSNTAIKALIFVGILMFSVVEKINFKDWTELAPAVIAVIMTPLTYNIAMGIELSILAYVIMINL